MNEMAWSYNSDHLMVATGVDGMGALDVISVFAAQDAQPTNDDAAVESKTDDFLLLDSLIAHSGACQHLAVDAQCRRLALGGTDRVVSPWSLTDLVCDRFVSFDVSTELRSLSFSPDGHYLAVATSAANNDEQVVLIVDADTAEPVTRVDARMKCSAVAWQPTRHTAQDTTSTTNNNNTTSANDLNKATHLSSPSPRHTNSTNNNNSVSSPAVSSPSVLAVVCDDKNMTYSATSTSNLASSSGASVFLRLIVFPPKTG